MLKAYTNYTNISIIAGTLIFSDNLATILAYYETNEISNRDPIYNYVLLVRRKLNSGDLEEIPTLSSALNISSEAIWNYPETNPTRIVARNFLNSSIYWIIAHEMGHIVHQHNTSNKTGQVKETEADIFASNLLHEIHLAPIGMAISMIYYSILSPILAQYDSYEQWGIRNAKFFSSYLARSLTRSW